MNESMIEPVDFSHFSDAPLYNIGAVVQATDLTPATLRAWERRYNVLNPERSDGGYRLYSERDIAILRWLKERVEEGMNISRAAALLQVAGSNHSNGKARSDVLPEAEPHRLASFQQLQAALLDAFLQCDESEAEEVLSEAFAMHGVERTCEQIVSPVMVEIGERWHRGELSPVIEHFATAHWRGKLHSLLDAAPHPVTGKRIVVGCVPGEWHEIGALHLTLFLRRRGHEVIYLGQNVPVEALINELEHLKPHLVCLSATTEDAANGLVSVSQALRASGTLNLQLTYGGHIFNSHPERQKEVEGVFLGRTVSQAVIQAENLLRGVGKNTG